MDYELRKCPFCNGTARLIEKFNQKTGVTFIEVTCLICGGRGKKTAYEEDVNGQKEQAYETAVASWNMRSND